LAAGVTTSPKKAPYPDEDVVRPDDAQPEQENIMTTSHANQAGKSEEHELLTINEAADLLRTPVATLRYWRSIGYGPGSFRVGRGVRYWRHEILDWLDRLSGNDGPHAA